MNAASTGLRQRALVELRFIRSRVVALEQLLQEPPAARASAPGRRPAAPARRRGSYRRAVSTSPSAPAMVFPNPCTHCAPYCGPHCPCSCHHQAVHP